MTERISVASDGAEANSMSGRRGRASLSADGTVVAFESFASNLVQADQNARDDVFVRDRASGETELISVSTTGEQGIGENLNPSISADGEIVAFDSNASNLVAGDANGVRDVFVRDRVAGTTERISVSASGGEGNAASFNASISADGRYVAFVSDATTLAPGENNLHRDIFVKDRVTGAIERVSVSNAGAEGTGFSTPPAISADGRFVAFGSFASNLVPGDTNFALDIFVHDRVARTTERVSVDSAGGQADFASFLPTISGDGRFAAFASDATNLVPGDTNAHEPGFGGRDIFVRDRLTGTTERVSVNSDEVQGDVNSAGPGFRGQASALGIDISDDGRFVTFDSSATNLVEGDTNTCLFQTIQFTVPGTCPDIFVRDRLEGITHRVSIGAGGAQGNHGSTDPSISDDGLVVAFFSLASNLVEGDTNTCIVGFAFFLEPGRCPDMFVHDVSGQIFSADIAVSVAAAPTPALIGRSLVYTSTVTNNGPSRTRRVILRQTLPANVIVLSALASSGTCTETNGVVECRLASLAAGSSASVRVDVRPTRLDPLTTTVSVTSRTADPVEANNSASLTTSVETH